MRSNLFIKILSSIPVILIALYFIPFLGVCLIILRNLVYNSKKKVTTSIILIIVGILILIPNIINSILNIANIKITTIPYLNDVISSDLYNVDFINYSKLLICVGVIFFIITLALNSLFNKFTSGIRNYITESEKKNYEISEKNDMKMKIKQEKAKNTGYVKCPYCGADNILSEKTGKCKFCRRNLENKNYKG